MVPFETRCAKYSIKSMVFASGTPVELGMSDYETKNSNTFESGVSNEKAYHSPLSRNAQHDDR